MERFAFVADESDSRSVVTVSGDIDLAAADKLWEELDQRIVAGGELVIDCSGIAFIDSMGLRTLIRALQKAQEVGAEFRLADVSEPVQRVLALAGVSELFAAAQGGAESAESTEG